jgi:hypothetical protein
MSRKFTAVFCACALMVGTVAGAESAPPSSTETSAPSSEVTASAGPTRTLTTAPLSLVAMLIGISVLGLEYEQAMSPNMAWHIAPFVTLGGLKDPAGNGFSMFGGGGSLGVRYFFFGGAPGGFWVSPVLKGSYSNFTATAASGGTTASSTISGYNLGGEGMLGYTFLFGGFTMSLGGGISAGYNSVDDSALSGGTTAAANAGTFGIGPAIRFNLGGAF